MKVIYFGTVKFIVEQDERDRFGVRCMNIISTDGQIRLVATKDIRENFWLLSNGQRWDVADVLMREEL